MVLKYPCEHVNCNIELAYAGPRTNFAHNLRIEYFHLQANRRSALHKRPKMAAKSRTFYKFGNLEFRFPI